MDGIVRTIVDASSTHFAELITHQRNGKNFHRAACLLSVALIAKSRFALRAAHLVVGPKLDKCQTGADAAEITPRAYVTAPDFRPENEIDNDGGGQDDAEKDRGSDRYFFYLKKIFTPGKCQTQNRGQANANAIEDAGCGSVQGAHLAEKLRQTIDGTDAAIKSTEEQEAQQKKRPPVIPHHTHPQVLIRFLGPKERQTNDAHHDNHHGGLNNGPQF